MPNIMVPKNAKEAIVCWRFLRDLNPEVQATYPVKAPAVANMVYHLAELERTTVENLISDKKERALLKSHADAFSREITKEEESEQEKWILDVIEAIHFHNDDPKDG